MALQSHIRRTDEHLNRRCSFGCALKNRTYYYNNLIYLPGTNVWLGEVRTILSSFGILDLIEIMLKYFNRFRYLNSLPNIEHLYM